MVVEYYKSNFCFPVRKLETDRLKLIAFKAEIHAQLAYDPDHSAYAHVYHGPFTSADDFVEKYIRALDEDEHAFAFAIIDKTKPSATAEDPDGALAGMITLTEGNVEARAAEITVRTLPQHQGSGVATGATRALLEYLFAAPHDGGLGLLRVEWHSSTANPASVAIARKLGFEVMGMIRYESCFKNAKARGKVGNGRPLPSWCEPGDEFRDLVMYVMYWDSWSRKGRGISSEVGTRDNSF
ncbi:acetyltransferase [Lojkania enalia]|uniref:Acetyltransferase n=1 Tax=Lojkania enalia TaxID=147567 RepID=A0A9P4TPQ3_9PLEO|nr:acetyltransferase [Didymosphaeria enalia]